MSELMNVSPDVESNCGGFGENETSFIPLCAMPASSLPGLSPLRGSGAVGYVCATSAGAQDSTRAAASVSVLRAVPISRSSSGEVVQKCFKCSSIARHRVEHGVHRCDLGGLHRFNVVRKH